jgi:DNA-binding MarR family transcriptional regulator
MTTRNSGATIEPTDTDYAELLRFRDALRAFLHWSERRARAAGLTPAQHQLLLAVRGHDGDPTIGEVADHLMLRHHSAVELVGRAERAGLLHRRSDECDHRIVRLGLTPDGESRLADLSAAHLDELHHLQSGLRLHRLSRPAADP